MFTVTGNTSEFAPELRTTARGRNTRPDSAVPGGDRIATAPTSSMGQGTTLTESLMVSLLGFSSPASDVKHVTTREPIGPATQEGNATVSIVPGSRVSGTV